MGNSERSRKHDVQNPDEAESSRSAAPFTATDIPVDNDGRIYHLQIRPEEIAPDILIVGDPGRAEHIGSRFLHDIELEHEHRGLVTITGTSNITGDQTTVISPGRTTVATSGIGTSSLEIVVNELVALNEIDFETRTRKLSFPRLHIIRVGTSGGLQASTELGTPIITTYSIGLDNAGMFYEAPYADAICKRLEGELSQFLADSMSEVSRFNGNIRPYVARAEPTLVQALQEASESLCIEVKTGLTASSPGFNAAQGRDIARMKPSIMELDKILSQFDPKIGNQCIENMEMESSFLLHFLGGIGHWAGAICPAIANRQHNTIDIQYQNAIENATKIALLALATTRNRHPDIRVS